MLLLLSSTPVFAQAPAPGTGAPNWEAIRKGVLTQIDQQAVQRWMAASMDQVLTAEDPSQPGAPFLKTLTDEMRNPASAQPYKAALAQVAGDTFNARYQAGSSSSVQDRQPLGVVYLLMALRVVAPAAPANYNGFLTAFQAVLADPSPAVRCQGLTGLNQIRASIPAAGRSAVVDSVRKVAATESNLPALTRMYMFLTGLGDAATQAQDLQPLFQAVREILDARLARIEQDTEVPTTADAEAAAWLAGKLRTLNNAQLQTAVTRSAARLLANAAFVYVHQSPPATQKEDLERVMIMAEEQLTQLLTAKQPNAPVPSPSVTASIAQGGAKQKDNVAAAVSRWIGTGQTAGALNAPQAFGFPPGLGIQRQAPAPATAPAS